MNARHFHALLQELIDANPFAIRAVLRLLEVHFTPAVPTLAVTREARPRLLVNLDFIGRHCRTDREVKAVILHEFLHVLLRHTEETRPLTPARHMALDAVINAIIHRQHGPDYSAMMARYYGKATDLKRLLRPMTPREARACREWRQVPGGLPRWVLAWDALYQGRLVADDIEALAQEIGCASSAGRVRPGGGESGPFAPGEEDPDTAIRPGDLLGNHDELGDGLPRALEAALESALKEMNGSGIWRSPRSRGIGASPYEALVNARDAAIGRWERRTLVLLKQHLLPDRHARATEAEPREYRIPVLSPGDRRAFVRALWSPYLPEASWHTTVERPAGTAQVYLDVSGSMDAEMPLVIHLLGRLARYIRRPFWAFSDQVAPARIEQGQLITTTSGGTSLTCVLEHLAKTRPASAVVVTDGYIEPLDPADLAPIRATRLHALVTRDGSPAALRRAGIPYTQLDAVPA